MTNGISTKSLLILFLIVLVIASVLYCENQRQEAEQNFKSGIQKMDSEFPNYCQAREHFENAVVIVKRWSFWPANLIVKRKPDYPFYMAVAAAVSSRRALAQPCPVPGFPLTYYAEHDLVSIANQFHTEAKEWGHLWYTETGQDAIPVLYTELCQWRKNYFEEFVQVIKIKAESDCSPNGNIPASVTQKEPEVSPTMSPTVIVSPMNPTPFTPTRILETKPPLQPITTIPVPTSSATEIPEPTHLPAPSIGVVHGEISFSQCRRTVIHWEWIRPLIGQERLSLRVVREHPTPQYETRAGGDYFEPETGQPREFRITDAGIQGSFWVFGYVSVDGKPISYESNRIFIVCGGDSGN